jgi:hypothetical protein
VSLRLWPFPFELVVPLYIAVLGAFFAGGLIAATYAGLAGLPLRFDRRRRARHERKLEEELARLRDELETARRAPVIDGRAESDDEARRRLIIAGDN